MTTTRQLTRNTKDGKIAGVAAGLGDYLAIDPVIIRLAFLLLVLAGGFGLLAYLVAWAVIPAADPLAPQTADRPGRRWDGRLVLGLVLVGAGAIVVAGTSEIDWGHDGPALWPLLLIGAGTALVLWRRDRPQPGPDRAAGGGPAREPGPNESGPDDAPTDSAQAATEVLEPAEGSTKETGSGAQASLPVSWPLEDTGPPLEDTTPYPAAPVEGQALRNRRLPVGWITLGALLAAAAVAALLDVLGALDISAQTFLLVALGLCGLGVVAGAVAGRVRGPLALGTATALALVAVSIVSVPVGGGVGERTFRPSTAAELEPEYRLGAGELVLDLRDVGVTTGEQQVEASVGVGRLLVIVPTGTQVQADGSASVGEVVLFGHEENGVGVEASAVAADSTPSFFTQTGRLVLDLGVGLGRVETRVADPVAAPSPRPATPRARAEARSAPDPRTGRSARDSVGLRG